MQVYNVTVLKQNFLCKSDYCSTEQICTEQYNRYLANNSDRTVLLLATDSDNDDEGCLNCVCQRLEE